MKISELIQKHDPQNQFKVLQDSYKQIETAWNNKIDLSMLDVSKVKNIVLSGLGGSAIGGDLITTYLKDDLKIPFIVNRNYSLPSFANKNTLIIISSYSGNTEETISVLNEAIERKCKIVAVTSGGEIKKISKKNKIPVVNVPSGFQPRYALPISFFSVLKVLQKLKLISKENENVKKIIELYKSKGKGFSAEGNPAFLFAEKLVGFIPVVYSIADLNSSVGYRFKCQFNENSKLHAFHNILPELNHNEIIGWESFAEKQFAAKIIFLEDDSCHPQIKKRITITSELASKSGVEVLSLKSNEENFKVRIYDLIYLCDWITFYLAVIRGFDPSEIDFINELKTRLS
jgi:glucose/mannose-6-phosphate isomerase